MTFFVGIALLIAGFIAGGSFWQHFALIALGAVVMLLGEIGLRAATPGLVHIYRDDEFDEGDQIFPDGDDGRYAETKHYNYQ